VEWSSSRSDHVQAARSRRSEGPLGALVGAASALRLTARADPTGKLKPARRCFAGRVCGLSRVTVRIPPPSWPTQTPTSAPARHDRRSGRPTDPSAPPGRRGGGDRQIRSDRPARPRTARRSVARQARPGGAAVAPAACRSHGSPLDPRWSPQRPFPSDGGSHVRQHVARDLSVPPPRKLTDLQPELAGDKRIRLGARRRPPGHRIRAGQQRPSHDPRRWPAIASRRRGDPDQRMQHLVRSVDADQPRPGRKPVDCWRRR
jgi:hypothetical protein